MSQEWGEVHPDAAQHQPYLDNMAAWRNSVGSGALPMSNFAQALPPETIRAMQEKSLALADARWEESLEVSSEPIEVSRQAERIAGRSEIPLTPRVILDPSFTSPEELQEAANAALENRLPSETSAGRDEPFRTILDIEDAFDPSENNAVRVLHHLKSADVTEINRVMDLERKGKARKGILGQEEDLIAKARKQKN
jgi:hypothetical protein